MKKYLAILAVLFALTGCEDEAERTVSNAASFQSPMLVGTLPSGQKVHQIVYKTYSHTHYIYVTDNIISDNVQQSKANRVYVTINGTKVPLEDVKKAVANAEARK